MYPLAPVSRIFKILFFKFHTCLPAFSHICVMKILRLILIITGLALLIGGFYSVFISEGPLQIGNTTIVDESGNQSFGMIGLGLIAIIAGFFMRRRRSFQS